MYLDPLGSLIVKLADFCPLLILLSLVVLALLGKVPSLTANESHNLVHVHLLLLELSSLISLLLILF